jgi:hypothetical protein
VVADQDRLTQRHSTGELVGPGVGVIGHILSADSPLGQPIGPVLLSGQVGLDLGGAAQLVVQIGVHGEPGCGERPSGAVDQGSVGPAVPGPRHEPRPPGTATSTIPPAITPARRRCRAQPSTKVPAAAEWVIVNASPAGGSWVTAVSFPASATYFGSRPDTKPNRKS